MVGLVATQLILHLLQEGEGGSGLSGIITPTPSAAGGGGVVVLVAPHPLLHLLNERGGVVGLVPPQLVLHLLQEGDNGLSVTTTGTPSAAGGGIVGLVAPQLVLHLLQEGGIVGLVPPQPLRCQLQDP